MAKINLLPTETEGAKRTKPSGFNLRIVPLALFSLTFIFLLGSVYMTLETMYRKKSLTSILNQYQQAEVLARKINSLKQDENKIIQELKLLNSYFKRDVLWSQKLSQLSALIPKEVWLIDLSFKRRTNDPKSGILYLKGGLIPEDKASSIGTLTKFVNQLKEDEVFFGDFDNLILADVQTESRKNIEIMTFIIELSLKKDKTS